MKKIIVFLLVAAVLVSLLSSCSWLREPGGKRVDNPLQSLSCIAALPAVTSVNRDNTIRFDQAKSLEKGAAYATSVISAQLAVNRKVRVLNSAQVSVLVPGALDGDVDRISELARKVDCEGVLVTTVQRFKQRQGTAISVKEAASVEFTLSLYHAPSGIVLWTSDYRETQQSLLENLFSLSKMQKRGFKWVTAEELLKQGVLERLAECPYLQ